MPGGGAVPHVRLCRRPSFALAGLCLLAALAGVHAVTLQVEITDFTLQPLPARRVTLYVL